MPQGIDYGEHAAAEPGIIDYGPHVSVDTTEIHAKGIDEHLHEYVSQTALFHPKESAQALVDTARHPGLAANSYSEQNNRIAQKAKDAFHRGDYTEAAQHALYYMLNGIPGFGARLDEAANKGRDGDIGGMLADTASVATDYIAGPKVLGAATSKLSNPGVLPLPGEVIPATKAAAKAAGSDIAKGSIKMGIGAAAGALAHELGIPAPIVYGVTGGGSAAGTYQIGRGLAKGFKAGRESFQVPEASVSAEEAAPAAATATAEQEAAAIRLGAPSYAEADAATKKYADSVASGPRNKPFTPPPPTAAPTPAPTPAPKEAPAAPSEPAAMQRSQAPAQAPESGDVAYRGEPKLAPIPHPGGPFKVLDWNGDEVAGFPSLDEADSAIAKTGTPGLKVRIPLDAAREMEQKYGRESLLGRDVEGVGRITSVKVKGEGSSFPEEIGPRQIPGEAPKQGPSPDLDQKLKDLLRKVKIDAGLDPDLPLGQVKGGRYVEYHDEGAVRTNPKTGKLEHDSEIVKSEERKAYSTAEPANPMRIADDIGEKLAGKITTEQFDRMSKTPQSLAVITRQYGIEPDAKMIAAIRRRIADKSATVTKPTIINIADLMRKD